MKMLPYLQVESDHVCAEIFNNCRTLAYMRNGFERRMPAVWRNAIFGDGDCHDCCCHTFDEGDYTTIDGPNPAPWFDPTIPASREVFGFLVDADSMVIESPNSSRLSGNRSARPEMIVAGTVIASSVRGENYFIRWLSTQLNNCCQRCSGLMLSMFESCAPLTDVCNPLDGILENEQNFIEQSQSGPYQVCYVPFDFEAGGSSLFSNVCPGDPEWVPGGSSFRARDLPSASQIGATFVPLPDVAGGCDLEIVGRFLSLIHI